MRSWFNERRRKGFVIFALLALKAQSFGILLLTGHAEPWVLFSAPQALPKRPQIVLEMIVRSIYGV